MLTRKGQKQNPPSRGTENEEQKLGQRRAEPQNDGFLHNDFMNSKSKQPAGFNRGPLNVPELFSQRMNAVNQSSAENGNGGSDYPEAMKGPFNQSTKTFSTADPNDLADGRFFSDKGEPKGENSQFGLGATGISESRSSGIVTPLTGTGLRKTFLRNNNRMITILEENEPSQPTGRRLFSSPEHESMAGARSPHRSTINIEQLRLGFSDGKGFLTKREEPEPPETSNAMRAAPANLFNSSYLSRVANGQNHGFGNSSRVNSLF